MSIVCIVRLTSIECLVHCIVAGSEPILPAHRQAVFDTRQRLHRRVLRELRKSGGTLDANELMRRIEWTSLKGEAQIGYGFIGWLKRLDADDVGYYLRDDSKVILWHCITPASAGKSRGESSADVEDSPASTKPAHETRQQSQHSRHRREETGIFIRFVLAIVCHRIACIVRFVSIDLFIVRRCIGSLQAWQRLKDL